MSIPKGKNNTHTFLQREDVRYLGIGTIIAIVLMLLTMLVISYLHS